jgi:hypothetical protein
MNKYTNCGDPIALALAVGLLLTREETHTTRRNTMSELEQNIDLEIANENLTRMQEKICEAGGAVSGFRPDSVFYNAELATIREVLVSNGLCGAAQYDNLTTGFLQEELAAMIDLGLADASLLDDAEEEVGPE